MLHDVFLAPSPNLTSVQRLLAHDAEPYRQSRLVVGSNNETIFAVTNVIDHAGDARPDEGGTASHCLEHHPR